MFPNLIIAMKAANMTQKQLALDLGITEKAMSGKLKERSDFTLTEAQRIAEILEPHSVDFLFTKKY